MNGRGDAAPLLSVEGLSHRFPNGRYGLRRIDLAIGPGEFLLIAGPNGSGKTLLMRHLVGLLEPCEGRVLYRGLEVRRDPYRARRKVGLVFQNADSQVVGQTVGEDVAFGPENLGLPRGEIDGRVEGILEATGIAHLRDASPHVLSGGEKRLLAIAGVLAMEPEVIVLDEPFANLDYPGVRRILRLVLSLHESGRTIVLITHELEKVLAHATRLVVLADGKIAACGAPAALLPVLESYDLRCPPHYARTLELFSWLA